MKKNNIKYSRFNLINYDTNFNKSNKNSYIFNNILL